MNRIRFLRLQKSMKQEELAKVIHVSQSSLSGYENEKYEPDKKTLLRLADFFGVSVDYLLGIDNIHPDKNSATGKIPIYSSLQSKPLSGLCGSILFFLDFNPYWKTDGEYFGIRVCGDWMEPRIFDGDIAIARRQNTVENGDIAVIQTGDGNAKVIRVAIQGTGILLLPYNSKYEISYYTNKEIVDLPVKILGKVVEFRAKC